MGQTVPVQLKLLRVGPYVHAVAGDIDGQVPDDPHAPSAGAVLQRPPLAKEKELHPFPEGNILPQGPPRPFQRQRLPIAQGRLPVLPGRAAVGALQRHKQSVILQPEGVVLTKNSKLRRRRGQQPGTGLAQHRVAPLVQKAVVHRQRLRAPIQRHILLRPQQAVRGQIVQIDQIGVSRKGGKALVGGIAKAGGTDGQQLPVGLSRRL